MSQIQPGILDPVPALARYLVFDLMPEAGPGRPCADWHSRWTHA